MRSLWLKLAAAFGLVIAVGMALVVGLVSRTTASQFELYVTRGGQALAEQIVPSLEAYYASSGSWLGVEALLADPWAAQSQPMGDWADHNGSMQGELHGQMMDSPAGAWAMFGSRVILAEARGTVVADSGEALAGSTLDAAWLAQGTPIMNDEEVVGTLLVVPYTAPASPAGDFLGAVNRAALAAGLATGGLALVVTGFLFFQIARPLHGLAEAAEEIAEGRLNARAPVRGRDEVGQVAASFNQMAEQLERYAAERKNMIADLAHELRTPLAVIQSNLEAMRDGVLPASAAELDTLHQEAVLLNRLIGDLRTLSLAEAGQLQLDRRPISAGEVVLSVAERFAALAAAQGTRLQTDIHSGLPLILADEQRLGQALANLVDNAVRYSPPGSQVVIGAEQAGPQVILTVTDDGPGLAPTDLPHVFDRFWRGERSRNRATGGSGLGLAIVRQLVEAHGGYVWVESTAAAAPGRPGHTRFAIRLPASSEAQPCRLAPGGA